MSAAAARQFRSIMSQVSWRVRSAQVPNLPNPAALTSTATSGSSSLARTRRVSTLSNRVRSRASGRIGVRSSAASASSRSPAGHTPDLIQPAQRVQPPDKGHPQAGGGPGHNGNFHALPSFFPIVRVIHRPMQASRPLWGPGREFTASRSSWPSGASYCSPVSAQW